MALIKAMTESGMVEGQPAGNQVVSVFKGIPFAATTAGENRWRAPQPCEKWQGVRQCFKFGPIPVQNHYPKGSKHQIEAYPIELPTSEDCLNLNIWTPAEKAGEKLPVAVWIFGGAYKQGGNIKMQFDGEAYAKRGVIYVSINYRLGVFGYMPLPGLEKEDPNGTAGNYGLLDQIAAIKWLRKNIEAFGGDPDNISIFGQSAGGLSVRTLTVSPLTKGDIKRAAMQSGGGFVCPFTENTLEEGLKLGQEFLDFLAVDAAGARKLQASEVLEKFGEFEKAFGNVNFNVWIDGYAVPEDSQRAILAGRNHDIDYMVGCTGDEGMKIDAETDPDKFEADARRKYGSKADEFIKLVGGRKIMKNATLPTFSGFCEASIANGRHPVHLYVFSRQLPGDDQGAFHGAEHYYVNETLLRCWRPFTAKDFELAENMNKYWCNFFKTGDPNGEGLPKWRPYTENDPCYMDLDIKCETKTIDEPVYKFVAREDIAKIKGTL